MRIVLVGVLLAAVAACGDDAPSQIDARVTIDAADPDAGTAVDADTPDASCFMNPQTHVEIINACTTAEKIDKHPVLPLLLPDGGLPPLP